MKSVLMTILMIVTIAYIIMTCINNVCTRYDGKKYTHIPVCVHKLKVF